ncbi:MAG: UvrD-helicase domain-containing protein, partial [Christensenellales bacterium]
MKNSFLQVTIDTKKTMLSSDSVFYKTENFIKQTKYISNVDFFISKFAENICLHLKDILQNEKLTQSQINCFKIETQDKKFAFLFKFGFQINDGLNKHDIIFFDYATSTKDIRQNDQRVNEYLLNHAQINTIIKTEKKLVNLQDFNKLYLISNFSGINLPKLNSEQKEIVETANKNVLVQGVAGSGKTNICIDKIIFSACKNYGGKILYTTFNRGLLTDTKLKVELYKRDLEQFLLDCKANNVLFLDGNHKK